METQSLKRELYSQLGIFLEYPIDDVRPTLQEAVHQIEPVSKKSSDHLKDFLSKMKRMELPMWQEYYVQSFDLMPPCSLYLSVHLFGEESFKRAELMSGLKRAYERHSTFEMTELPDHLAVVLRQNNLLDDDEWSDLVSMCILPALPIIIGKLEKNGNTYLYVLKAIQTLLLEMEKVHA